MRPSLTLPTDVESQLIDAKREKAEKVIKDIKDTAERRKAAFTVLLDNYVNSLKNEADEQIKPIEKKRDSDIKDANACLDKEIKRIDEKAGEKIAKINAGQQDVVSSTSSQARQAAHDRPVPLQNRVNVGDSNEVNPSSISTQQPSSTQPKPTPSARPPSAATQTGQGRSCLRSKIDHPTGCKHFCKEDSIYVGSRYQAETDHRRSA